MDSPVPMMTSQWWRPQLWRFWRPQASHSGRCLEQSVGTGRISSEVAALKSAEERPAASGPPIGGNHRSATSPQRYITAALYHRSGNHRSAISPRASSGCCEVGDKAATSRHSKSRANSNPILPIQQHEALAIRISTTFDTNWVEPAFSQNKQMQPTMNLLLNTSKRRVAGLHLVGSLHGAQFREEQRKKFRRRTNGRRWREVCHLDLSEFEPAIPPSRQLRIHSELITHLITGSRVAIFFQRKPCRGGVPGQI